MKIKNFFVLLWTHICYTQFCIERHCAFSFTQSDFYEYVFMYKKRKAELNCSDKEMLNDAKFNDELERNKVAVPCISARFFPFHLIILVNLWFFVFSLLYFVFKPEFLDVKSLWCIGALFGMIGMFLLSERTVAKYFCMFENQTNAERKVWHWVSVLMFIFSLVLLHISFYLVE